MRTDLKNFSFVGYSGHSYVCLEIAALNEMFPVGYYDTYYQEKNPFDLDYLGDENVAPIDTPVFVCIGENNIRKKVYEKMIERNCDVDFNLLHPNATISKKAKLGMNTLVAAGALINPLSTIGKSCIINTGAIIEHECEIADFVHIAPGAVLAGNVRVGQGTFIGANSVVKQGVNIGEKVIVGAGTVILNDVPDNVTIVGNPGKIIK